MIRQVVYFRVTWRTSQSKPKKHKKKSPHKKFLIFPEIKFSSSNIKRIVIFSPKKAFLMLSQKKAVLMFWETFYISVSNFPVRKSKLFYTFPYKEAIFSKLKYFLIIIIKRFFSFYNIFFFYTQQAFVFHLLRDFCNVHDDHIDAFFSFFFFRKILISFTSFFLIAFLYFLDSI